MPLGSDHGVPSRGEFKGFPSPDNILIGLVDVLSFDDIDHLNKKIKDLTYNNINDCKALPKEPEHIQPDIPIYTQPHEQEHIQTHIPTYTKPKEPEHIQPYIPIYIEPPDHQAIINTINIKKSSEQRPILNSKKPIRSYGSLAGLFA